MFDINIYYIINMQKDESQPQDLDKVNIVNTFPLEMPISSHDTILIPEKYIRKDEFGKIQYSLKGLFSTIDLLETTQFKKYYDKKKLQIHQHSKSFINEEFIFGRMHYTIHKKDLPKSITVKNLFDAVRL